MFSLASRRIVPSVAIVYGTFIGRTIKTTRTRTTRKHTLMTSTPQENHYGPGFGINHEKRAKLRNMKVLVLDNSLRESTVAQPAGHTLDNKFEILKQIKLCGFDNVIVAVFGGISEADRRVDDAFCEKLQDNFNNACMTSAWTYSFSELSDSVSVVDGQMKLAYGEENVPGAMQKMKQYGISSAIIEIDVDYTKTVPMSEVVEVFTFLLTWANANFQAREDPNERCRHMVNL